MRRVLLFVFLCSITASGQSITMWPATTTGSPAQPYMGATQSISALITGQNDQRVNWSTTCGTLSSAATPAVTGPQTAGLYSATAQTCTVTATSVVGGLTGTAVVKFLPSPTPIACSSSAPDTSLCHPRFLTTPTALAGLRAKAVSGNALYASGAGGLATNKIAAFASYFTWSTWSGSACTGGSGPTADVSSEGQDIEEAVLFGSSGALFDNSSTNRNTYGCESRDLDVTMMNYVLNGTINVAGNVGRWADGVWGPWGFTIGADNLMSGGYLSASDIALTHTYYAWYGKWLVTNARGDGIAPDPVSSNYNNPALFVAPLSRGYKDSQWAREAGNNYTNARMMMLAILSLTFDDNTTDDPNMPTGGVGWATLVSGGSTWTVGEQATISGGSAVVQCTAISGGGGSGPCTAITVVTPATGYTNSGSTLTTTATSGSGTGLTVTVFAENTCGATRYNLCSDGTGGSLHAYWYYANKALQYLEYATMEDPTIVQSAYQRAYSMSSAPSCATAWGGTMPCLGINQGGEAVEGLIYGGSSVKVVLGLTAIHNAGWDDPLLWGPQAAMMDMSYWDLRYLSDATQMNSLNAIDPATGTGQTGAGGWDFLSWGDTQTPYLYPSYIATESALMAYDAALPTPRTDRTNALNWITLNLAFGMADGTQGNCSTHGFSCGFMNEIGSDYGSETAIQLFEALPSGNPVTTSPPTDPRPSMPTDFYDIGNKHLVLRNNWSSTGTMFSFLATDTQVDHEHQADGRFDIASNGYWITKGRWIFNNYNTYVTSTQYQNLVKIVNSTSTGYSSELNPYGPGAIFGQGWHGYQTGLTPFAYSDLPTYAAMHVDQTNAYNSVLGTNTNDVLSANRDVIYNRSANVVAVYDRDAVGHSASTQVSYFNTTGAVTFSGSRATWNDQSGTQKAVYDPLYPAGATVSATPWYNYLKVTIPTGTLSNSGTVQVATATASYADGTTQNAFTYPDQIYGQTVTFFSDTPSLCSVTSAGLITAAATGSGECLIFADYTFGPNSEPAAVWTPAELCINIVTSSPGCGNLSAQGGEPGPTGDWQPVDYIAVKPSGTPLSTNFGSVLQWMPSASTPVSTSAIASSSGQGYDGMLAGTTAYWFMKSLATFVGVTFPASGATTHYVANLAPNTTYTVTGTGTPATVTTDNAGVAAVPATGTGNITVGAYIPPSLNAITTGVTLSLGVSVSQ